MWLQQHSQWLDLRVACLVEAHALHVEGVVRALVGRCRSLGLGVNCQLRQRHVVPALARDRVDRFCRVVYLGELVRELVLRRVFCRTDLALAPQLLQTRHRLRQLPIGRVPNFLQVRLFQRWFLPIPLDVLIISLVCVARSHCDFFQEAAGDDLMMCLVCFLEQ
jgi:hypothetical protein